MRVVDKTNSLQSLMDRHKALCTFVEPAEEVAE